MRYRHPHPAVRKPSALDDLARAYSENLLSLIRSTLSVKELRLSGLGGNGAGKIGHNLNDVRGHFHFIHFFITFDC